MFKTKTMRRPLPFALLLWGIVLLGAAGNAAGSGAWWQLCDSCTDDSHFRYQALNAPAHHAPIYVTNRDTNETRKYNRWTFTEDFDGSLVQWTEVVAADFPASEKSVFEQAVQDSNIIFATIPRSDLRSAGLGEDSGSVVGDITDGEISTFFVNAAILQVELRNLLPTHVSVNAEAGLSTPIAGANYGQGGTIRKRNLLINIIYADGSAIEFRLKPDGSIVGWGAVDAEGNSIPLEAVDGDGPIPIAGGSFADRDFRFGSGNGGNAEALAATVGGGSGGFLECTVSTSGGVTTVSCSKVK